MLAATSVLMTLKSRLTVAPGATLAGAVHSYTVAVGGIGLGRVHAFHGFGCGGEPLSDQQRNPPAS